MAANKMTCLYSFFLVYLSYLSVLRPINAAAPFIASVASIRDSSARLTPQPNIQFLPANQVQDPNVLQLNVKQHYQSILGFGGAITDAATLVISQLPSHVQQEIVEAYYGNKGNKYTIGRIHMNSCDFSPKSYSFDDVADDFDLIHFDSKVSHDNLTMIPFAQRAAKKAAQGGRELKLFLTPWSPPAWMKANNAMTGSYNPCLKSDKRYHQAWANYYVKFMEAYKNYGLNFWGMTVQNEVEFAAPWEACVQTPAQHAEFIRDFLGPTLAQSQFFSAKIMIYDHNKDDMLDYTAAIDNDPEAKKFVWGIGVHWYSGDSFDHVQAAADDGWNIMATEACNCPGVLVDNWERAAKYAHDILGDLNAGAKGWTDWNIVLDYQGGPNHLGNYCDAPIIADKSGKSIHYQPTYYILGHFSRYLPYGAVRVANSFTAGGNEPLEITTWFVPDSGHSVHNAGQIVMIAHNPSNSTFSFKLLLQANNLAAKINIAANSIYTLSFEASIAY
jgi:glucosylceramidase